MLLLICFSALHHSFAARENVLVPPVLCREQEAGIEMLFVQAVAVFVLGIGKLIWQFTVSRGALRFPSDEPATSTRALLAIMHHSLSALF
jgi:hypothetical protein